MRKIRKCEFNMDTACVELVFDDGTVIAIDTIFDALIRAGKKPVIVAYGNCSLSNIFLQREMDYHDCLGLDVK